ncbi:MAG: hypothetical protein ABGY95_12605 [Rubritalea sp.]|jgi:hypothetical protein|uniref:hypothetical protein n=1 Tax=Rubritalea sp. TaxID=2109375 RepID=UPI003241F965
MNSKIPTIIISTITMMALSGCSCVVFVKKYSLSGEITPINKTTVQEAAELSKFNEKELKKENTYYFKRRNLRLLYNESEQTISLNSRYCPFIPFRMNPTPWQTRCNLYTEELKIELMNSGITTKDITFLEFETKPTPELEPNGGDQ